MFINFFAGEILQQVLTATSQNFGFDPANSEEQNKLARKKREEYLKKLSE